MLAALGIRRQMNYVNARGYLGIIVPTIQCLLEQKTTTKIELVETYRRLEWPSNPLFFNGTEPSDLSQTMLLLGAFPPPRTGISNNQRTWLKRARHLRAALPQWHHVQRKTIVECFVLPRNLANLIAAYSTPAVNEIWSCVLGVWNDMDHPPRRSDRVRQRLQ